MKLQAFYQEYTVLQPWRITQN